MQWFVLGIVLLVVGLVIQTSLFQWLVDMAGWLMVIIGIGMIAVALFSKLFGKKQGQGAYVD